MPRQARKKSKSGIYHVVLRGINKQIIFEDDEDRRRFIETIGRFKNPNRYEVYGYCLMNNHIHLLVKETGDTIGESVKRICGSYAYWYNRKYNRCGHLFQERYNSEAVEDDGYLLMVLRYIHQNPLKAGIVQKIGSYNWSSYIEYTGTSNIVDTCFVMQMLSKDHEIAIDIFIKYTNEINKDKFLDLDKSVRLTDDEAKARLIKIGIQNISKLQYLDRKARNEMLGKAKAIEGISIRQLSRLTGISKNIIERA